MEEENGVYNEVMGDLDGRVTSSDEDEPKSNYTLEIE